MKIKYLWHENLGVVDSKGNQWLQLVVTSTKKFRTIAGKLLVRALNEAQPYRLP